jgi:NADH-quinone oxidoreductase subunit A
MEPGVGLIPILVMLGFACVVGAGALFLGRFLGPRRYDKVKFETYECGVKPLVDANRKISVKYYLVAILFLLFDLEVAFLLPIALAWQDLKEVGPIVLVLMGYFFVFFLLGLWYEFRVRALEWER